MKQRIIPLSVLLLVIAITIILFFYGRSPERIASLKNYQYFGAFLISLIGNATVLLPGIVLPILTGLGVYFYKANGLVGPILVGLAGSTGAAIGELVGYVAGYSGRRIVTRNRRYEKMTDGVKRWGSLAIFTLALVPLFFDVVGIAAGVLRFPIWKFILFCWLGRTVLYVLFITLAALGLKIVLPWVF